MTIERVQLYRKTPSGEAIRFSGKSAEDAYKETKELMAKLGIDSYLDCVNGEIKGSELRSMILLNQVLSKKNQRTLNYDEAMHLGNKFLPRNLYADLGIAVFEKDGLNNDLREILAKEANKRGWKFPILAHPYSLTLKDSNVHFGEDDSLIVHGEQAVEELNRFDCGENSGVLRLYRGSYGGWGAHWDDLFVSYESGRVPWIRAEGATQKFEKEILTQIEKAHQEKVEKLNARKEKAIAEAFKIYNTKE